MRDIQASPAELRRCGSGMSAVAESIATANRSLFGTLDSLNGCWGSRSVGTQFAESYVPAEGGVRTACEELGTFLEDFAESFEQAARDYESVEDANTVGEC